MKKYGVGLGVMVGGLLGAVVCSSGLVLVEDGQNPVPIILAEDLSPAARQAASALVYYIQKTSGTAPELLRAPPPERPERAIWVGVQPAVERVFPDVDFTFGHPEEILMHAGSDHLVIAGRDRRLNGTWVEEGTANAVYTFIQDYLGVRWLWPGPLGEDILHRDTLVVEPFTHRFHPPFLSRQILIYARRWGVSLDWTRFQRLALDSRKGPTGSHAFTDWWDRFHETRPDYFALQPDGSRSGYPKPAWAKLCKSNPDVWQEWLRDTEERLRRMPSTNYLVAAANDVPARGICVCENCRAWDRLDAPKVTYSWAGGKREEYVSLSDRYVTFWNHLARLLKERFPDRDDLFVRVNAYLEVGRAPPLGPGLAENTALAFVGYFPFTTEEQRNLHKEQWLKWAEKSPRMLYRPNLWYFAGGIWGLPEVSLQKTMEDFRFLADHRCGGLFIDLAREHWATQGPQYYLMAQLAWDPRADGDAILRDYYQRGFGPAAEDIERYWSLMEQAREDVVGQPDFRLRDSLYITESRFLRRVFTPTFLDQAEDILDRAAMQAAGQAPYEQRVAFVRAGFEYTRLLFETMPLMDRVRQSGGRDVEAVRGARENWDRIDTLIREAGPAAFNYESIKEWLARRYWNEPGIVADYLGPPSEEYQRFLEQDASVRLIESLPRAGWGFRLDPDDRGTDEEWFLPEHDDSAWDEIGIEKAWQHFGYDYIGAAWYRILFELPPEGEGNRVEIHFGGVDESAWVYVNGVYAGKHDQGPSGWDKPFSLDITDQVGWGGENLLAVRVRNTASKGGIWQPVTLSILNVRE